MKNRPRPFFLTVLRLVAIAWAVITAFNYEESRAKEKYILARQILGRDFISPEELVRKDLLRDFPVEEPVSDEFAYNKLQLLIFHFTLPSRDTLLWCHNNGYMIVAGPSKSIALRHVIGLFPIYSITQAYPYWAQDIWYLRPEEKFFREEKIGPDWLVIRKTPVPGSTNHTWPEQLQLLSPAERVPKAVEVEWAILMYQWINGEKLFPETVVRTSSVPASGKSRMRVGIYFGTYMVISADYEWNRASSLGLSSARTP